MLKKYFLSLLKLSGVFLFSLFLFFGNTACKNNKVKAKDTTDSVLYSKMPPEIKLISEKIAKDNNNASLYHERAKLYIKLNDIESARIDMQKVISIDTTKAEYFYTLADLYFMSGKAGNSKAALEKCLSIDAKNTDAILKLAEISYFMKDYKKVLELTNKVLEIDKTNATAYFIKGRSAKEESDTIAAIKLFQKATGLNTKYYDAYIQLGIIFAAKKNPIALDYYNNALNLMPNSSEAIYNMGMYFQETAQYNKAIEAYTSIIQVKPTGKFKIYLELANYNLGYVHYQYLSSYEQASKHFNAAILANPEYVEAIYMRGLCLEKLGDVDGARRDYKKALELKPEYDKPLKGLNRLDASIRKK
ncbi:MAG: tetratricopeptide repeat protein [Bacteroidota bacterium]